MSLGRGLFVRVTGPRETKPFAEFRVVGYVGRRLPTKRRFVPPGGIRKR